MEKAKLQIIIKQMLFFIMALCASMQASAMTVPPASNWSLETTVLVQRNSPAPTTSITDISRGVLFEYNAPTGGNLVGTSTRQYDFTTIATEAGSVFFDIDVDAIVGGFNNRFSLSILQNGSVIETLFATTANTVDQMFLNNSLVLAIGDEWGIRAVSGNFARSTGSIGEIQLTSPVPIPAAGWLLLSGICGLLVCGRKSRSA